MSEGWKPRDGERVSVEAFVKLSGADQEFVFRTRDLSQSGLFLYTKVARAYPIDIGAFLRLELFDYDRAVECTVKVVRMVAPGSSESDEFPTGFGVQITDIEPDQRRRLLEMIERIGSGEPPY